MGNGIVYSSKFMDDDEALATLQANLEGEPLAAPRRLAFTTGRRKLAWNANVVSMGLSSGFIEPLESTSIHFVQAGIAKLIALFPDRRFNPVERDEYNRQMQDLFEDTRDFIILHYNATRRNDSPFWDYCRMMTVPDSLARRVALWKAKGRLFREGYELFATTSWVAVMLGQGIMPEEYEPAVDALDEERVGEAIEQMRLAILATAERLPTHAEFVAITCSARGPAVPPPLPEFVF
jgi:tryptophan halogenase